MWTRRRRKAVRADAELLEDESDRDRSADGDEARQEHLPQGSTGHDFDRPLIAFDHEGLRRGLADLCHEVSTPDSVFNLHAEGWTMQALAHLARLYQPRLALRTPRRGGLPAASLRRVQDFVRANLSASSASVRGWLESATIPQGVPRKCRRHAAALRTSRADRGGQAPFSREPPQHDGHRPQLRL